METKYTVKTDIAGKPSIYSSRGIVCTMEAGYDQTRHEDAALIVRAANAHDDLVAALSALVCTARTFRNVPKDEQEWTSLDDEALDAAFAALAKAKGEQ